MRLVTLKKDHKQGDTQHYAGQTVLLDEETANWLSNSEIAEKIASRVPIEEPVSEEDTRV